MPEHTNSIGLKEKLLTQIPKFQAHKSKYEVKLMFKDNAGERFSEAKKRDYKKDTLMRAANIIRNETVKKHFKFTGSLTDKQYDDNTLSGVSSNGLDGTKIQN